MINPCEVWSPTLKQNHETRRHQKILFELIKRIETTLGTPNIVNKAHHGLIFEILATLTATGILMLVLMLMLMVPVTMEMMGTVTTMETVKIILLRVPTPNL